MTNQKKGKGKWILISLGVLFISLCAHIYFTTNNLDQGHANFQLYRIDFKQQVDSLEAAKIAGIAEGTKGVTHAFFNVKDGILIYSVLPETIGPEVVFNKIQNEGKYKAERFVLPQEMMKRGCPVMKGGEVSRRLTVYFTRLKVKFS